MFRYLHITRYHIVVIFLYILLVPVTALYLIPEISFAIATPRIIEVWSILLISLLGLVIYLFANNTKVTNLNIQKFLLIIFYSLAFAVPEEILFRGFVQTQIGDYYNSTITVLMSSLVFGFVHLLNGAKGVAPSKWNWNLIVLATIGGIPLGSLFIITESLFYPITLHALFLMGLQLFIKDKNTLAKTTHILRN